jgi:hypothetical protein
MQAAPSPDAPELAPFDALSYTYLTLKELLALARLAQRPALDSAIEAALAEAAEALSALARQGRERKAADGDAA